MVVVIWVGFMAQWLWHPDTCPYGPYLWVRYLQLGIDGHLIESRGRNALPCYVIWSQKWLTGASKIINQAIGSPHFLWLRNNKVWRLPTWLLTCHWISLYLDNKARHDKRIKFMILFVPCNIFVITRKGFVLLTFFGSTQGEGYSCLSYSRYVKCGWQCDIWSWWNCCMFGLSIGRHF